MALILTVTASCALADNAASDSRKVTVRLWPNASSDEQPTVLPPRGKAWGTAAIRITNITSPTLTIHPAPGTKTPAPAVLVCPGGAYKYLVIDKEGTEIAQWLNSIGITAAILQYRVPDNRPGALQDARRAMKLIRQNARAWNIDSQRVGAIGFSAGGHLVAQLSTGYNAPAYEKIDVTDSLSCRPDFSLLIYPAYLTGKDGKLKEDIRVTGKTPPAFILQTQDDHGYGASSVAYYQALTAAKVPTELHIFQKGGHGYGLRKSENPVSGWPKLCEQWLKSNDIIGNADRTLILDMVHHNPHEPHYKTAFNDPGYLQKTGYNGKVYSLFESPTLAITWETVCKDIFPLGSPDRKWLEAKVASIKKQQAACHAAGLSAYAMADLICFPKRLVEKLGIEETFGDPTNPKIQELLRVQIDEMFAQFPDFDGLVVRIGETYLHDAPYHIGAIKDKTDPEKTIIPLVQLLREEVCVKRNKQLVFRTWVAFDTNLDNYLKISNTIEPHKNLVFSFKHTEYDFHRANPFSKIIGQGRHRQVIEVQCAREYEGKGTYPNYVANGVVEGFEEHAFMSEDEINSLRDFIQNKPELFGGIWTWSRGGGWNGPYTTNEMWCTLNAWVMVQWAHDPSQSEEAIFNRYARERLNLKGKDIKRFRRLCLLSTDAVVRGRNSTHGDMNPWWTRDQGIGWPGINKDPKRQARNLRQKDESLAMWDEIVELAEAIKWNDEATRTYAIASSKCGRRLYGIYHALIYLADAESKGDTASMRQWIKAYDEAWESYSELTKIYPGLFTLYKKDFRRHMASNAHEKVDLLRAELAK